MSYIKTPFYDFHVNMGAKMVDFAGYLLPIQYKGVNFEHNHVRNHVGVFDVSHMSQIMIEGDNAFDLVQKLTVNDVSCLHRGQAQYTCMLNHDGGIIDDLIIYYLSNDSFMLVVNAANSLKDFNWICSNNDMDVEITDITHDRSLLAVQGPKADSVLQDLTNISLKDLPNFSFEICEFAGCQDIIISKTGYTGSGGFELYFNKAYANLIWNSIFNTDNLVEPIGLAARDTLRLEMGFCLYGNDIDELTSPIEAGLSWIVKMNKDFIGKDAIKKQLDHGVSKKIISFILEEKGVPRKDYKILNKFNHVIGSVSSGTMSPSFHKGFGMGYVSVDEAYLSNEIYIQVRAKNIRAKIIKLPFHEY